jgi:hypothetical protein
MVRDPDLFFGRGDDLRRVYEAIYHQQCLSIVGSRHIGKSSLLGFLRSQDFQRRFGYDFDKYILAFIDMGEQPQKTHEQFLSFVSKELIKQSQKRLSMEMLRGRSIDDFRDFINDVKDGGYHPVLLLDEFDSITSMPQFDLSFFSFLRAQANAGRISYSTASSASLDKVCHSGIVGSPFFNIFVKHDLGPLTKEEALELVGIPCQKAGYPFTDTEREWILNIAGRHPFFLQRASYFLFEEKRQPDTTMLDFARIETQVWDQLLPHFQYIWKHLDEQKREQLAWEARLNNARQRMLPEFSESLLFRKLVRKEWNIDLSIITIEDLEKLLEHLDDLKFLGESKLNVLNAVYIEASHRNLSIVEKGILVKKVLMSAIDTLKIAGIHKKEGYDYRLYEIIKSCYRDKKKNEQVAASLGISTRQFFRDRKNALGALLKILLEMEISLQEELDM